MERESYVLERCVAVVTDLIPNLEDLLAALPLATSAGRDAAELASATSRANTWTDVDAVLDAVVTGWAMP